MTAPLYSGPKVTAEQDDDEIAVTVDQQVTEIVVEPQTPAVVEVVFEGPQGPRGPQGEPGAPGEMGPAGMAAEAMPTAYMHTQANVPSRTWLVQHHLGFRPGGFHVTDLDGNDVEPVVTHLSENVALLTFFSPTAGTASVS
jgi:hypothetical protein